VLVYDPVISAQGTLSIRAFKLSDTVLQLYKQRRPITLSVASELGLTSQMLLVELPVRLKVGALHRALLLWLADHEELAESLEALDLSNADHIKKNLEHILLCLGELQREQNALAQWQRAVGRLDSQQKQFIEKRKAENALRKARGESLLAEDVHDLELENPSLFRKIPEPGRLDAMLLTLRASDQASQVANYAGRALTNQYATRTFEAHS